MPDERTPPADERLVSRFRRSASLVCYWDDEGFVVENYLTGRRTRAAPALIDLLNRFSHLAARDEIIAVCESVKGDASLVETLLDQTLLVDTQSEFAKKEARIASEWRWGVDARHFHYSTNAVSFECNDERVWTALEERAQSDPPPPPYKELEGNRVPLPPPRPLTSQLGDALLGRRTCRAFADDAMSAVDFASILWWTWGKTHHVTGQDLGDIVLKTSPSGGSRHPVEVYPVALRVEGIPPGIYHYSVRDHSLTLMREGSHQDAVLAFSSHQSWVRDASAVFVMTAVVGRTMWKYHHSHAYRVIQMDAGHLGQTFHLTCQALGFGPFTTAATNNPLVESTLGIDGVREIVLYLCATGRSAERSDVAPVASPGS